jgi:uncharacterized RDD family membrane protein YckC
MQCVRCSHPLPPRADRCLRCFTLNPQNSPAPLAVPVHDSGPARPVQIELKSDPAPQPVCVSFTDEPVELGDIDIEDAITEPDPAPQPAPTPSPEVISDHIPQRAEVISDHLRGVPRRAGALSRLVAWGVDLGLLGAAVAAHLYAATLVVPTPYYLEAIVSQLPVWMALAACLAVAYSWLFVALGARTPGMALAGQSLQTLQGRSPSPAEALLRALLALPSAALGLFGFVLALFDSRGQTLHDKLCRCVVVVSAPDA